MPAARLSMRKVREVLRQRYACGASERVIAQSLGIGRTAVGEYIRRAAVIGITWPVPDELDDTALERRLFAPAGYNPPRSKPLPDWAHVHAELRRRGIRTLLMAGIASNVCVESTIRDAYFREYWPVMIEDATMPAGSPEVQRATIHNVTTFFGWVSTASEVAGALHAK